MKLFLQ